MNFGLFLLLFVLLIVPAVVISVGWPLTDVLIGIGVMELIVEGIWPSRKGRRGWNYALFVANRLPHRSSVAGYCQYYTHEG